MTDAASATDGDTAPLPVSSSGDPETLPLPVTAPARRRVSWDVIRVLALIEVVIFHDTYLGPATEPGIPDLKHP
ncbi:MAG: hypothetical protein J2P18_16590, partial [Nocardia sp.]|nr:hypothetical protein [Nocardia sp.]